MPACGELKLASSCSASVGRRASSAGRESCQEAQEVVGARGGAEQLEKPGQANCKSVRAGMRCSRVLCWRRFSCR